MSFSLLDLAIIMITAAGIGGVSGFFGVGGAFLLVPVLNVVLGIPVELAVAAAACQVLGLATTALSARRVRGRQLQLPLILAGGLFVGVLAGAHGLHLAQSLGNTTIGGREVDIADVMVLSLYCLLLTGLGLFSLRSNRQLSAAGAGQSGCGADVRSPLGNLLFSTIPPFAEIPDCGAISITGMAWLGLVIGGVSGLLGISGGLILVPALTLLVGMPTRNAVMASLAIVWLATAQTTAVHAWRGTVDLWLVSALLLGGTVGARIGSDIGERVGGAQFRRWFAYLLLVTAVLIAWRLVWLFGAA